MARLLWLVLVVVSLCGCGFQADGAEVVFVRLDDSVTEARRQDILRAMAKWNGYAVEKALVDGPGEGGWVLTIHDLPEPYGGWTASDTRTITVSPNVSPENFYAVVLHELGHALGMSHVGKGVMQGSGATQQVEFSSDDDAEASRVGLR